MDERGRNLWAKFTQDMTSYVPGGARPWSLGFLRRLVREAYIHPGLVAVVVYRYGQWVNYRCKVPLLRQLFQLHYYGVFLWVRTQLQTEIWHMASIDGGFHIFHYGSIIVHGGTMAGKNLSINHGVIIGGSKTSVPTLGDNVQLAVGAKLIGDIEIGDNVMVGAGAVVVKSFPANVIIAGVPAKVLGFREQSPLPETRIPVGQH